MFTHRCSLKVRYRDIDYLGTVYYSRYLEYFEVARDEMMTALGMQYSEFEKQGYAMPVVEAHCIYHHGAEFDEVLDIQSRIRELPTARLRIEYAITSAIDGWLIAEGYTVHAFINQQKKAVRPPQFFLALLQSYWR